MSNIVLDNRLRWLAVAFGALTLFGWAEPVWSAPQTFNTALPVAKGEFVFREQAVLDQSGDDPGTSNRNRTAWSAVSVLGYGFTGDFAGFVAAPYVDKRLELTESGQRRARSARGLGDIRLFGRYTAYKKDGRGKTFRIAPFIGLETPTGNDNESDSFGRLPASVQPGSGSWDPFGGVVLTYQTLDYQMDAQLSYQANTKANDFEFGDVVRLDASLQYRLWPRELKGGVPGFLYGVLEANLIHKNKNASGGIDDQNSGGFTMFLVPGLQYVTKRWILEGAVQIPVVQDLNGTALESDYVARVSFRVNF